MRRERRALPSSQKQKLEQMGLVWFRHPFLTVRLETVPDCSNDTVTATNSLRRPVLAGLFLSVQDKRDGIILHPYSQDMHALLRHEQTGWGIHASLGEGVVKAHTPTTKRTP